MPSISIQSELSRGATARRDRALDWKTIGNYVLLVSLFVTVVTMVNQANGRLDAMNSRMDAMQIESNIASVSMGPESNHQQWRESVNNAQRDLLVKAFADVAKGLLVGVLLAAGAGKISIIVAGWGVVSAMLFYVTGHNVAGGVQRD